MDLGASGFLFVIEEVDVLVVVASRGEGGRGHEVDGEEVAGAALAHGAADAEGAAVGELVAAGKGGACSLFIS